MRRQDPNKIDKEKMASASSIPNLHVSSTAGAESRKMEGRMRHNIETREYNQRRYGKPWIAKVDFSDGTKGDYTWGDWAGDTRNGGAGILTIEAEPGDMIAQGQKDFRKPRNSAAEFSVVKGDGNLEDIGDKGAAYKYWLTSREAKVENAAPALKAERARLVDRIAEIDKLLEA